MVGITHGLVNHSEVGFFGVGEQVGGAMGRRKGKINMHRRPGGWDAIKKKGVPRGKKGQTVKIQSKSPKSALCDKQKSISRGKRKKILA